MEQVFKAVAAVKVGKGIGVSAQRKAELEAQFPDNTDSEPPAGFEIDMSLKNDVGLWPSLAEAFLNRL